MDCRDVPPLCPGTKGRSASRRPRRPESCQENLSLAEAAIKEEVRTVGKELASLLLHRDTVLVAERGDQSEACQVVREGTLDQRFETIPRSETVFLTNAHQGSALQFDFSRLSR